MVVLLGMKHRRICGSRQALLRRGVQPVLSPHSSRAARQERESEIRRATKTVNPCIARVSAATVESSLAVQLPLQQLSVASSSNGYPSTPKVPMTNFFCIIRFSSSFSSELSLREED